MPIEGALRELALADLLQLIHLSRKSGVLAVRGPHSSRPAELHFDRGALVGAIPDEEAPRLGWLLVMAGKATDAQVERALEEQRNGSTLRIGSLLVRQGVPSSEVRRQLEFQIQEALFDMVRWSEGEFVFHETDPPDPGPLTVRLGIERLLLDALRRTDEWGALSGDPHHRALIPGLVESDTLDRTPLSLGADEWEVLAAVDGETPLRSIGHRLGRSELDVAKAVFALIDRGVVELGPREGRPWREDRTDPSAEEARARAEIHQGHLDAAEERIDRLAKLHPDRAALLSLRGDLEGARGRWHAALECYMAAVRLDPLHASVYYSLGVTAIRAGELGRARDAFDTYIRLPDARGDLGERAGRASVLLEQLQTFLEEEGA